MTIDKVPWDAIIQGFVSRTPLGASRRIGLECLLMKLAAKHRIHPEETEVMVDPSAKVKVIPREVKFKNTHAESSKVRHKRSTSDGLFSNPIALLWKEITSMETRLMNRLKSNGCRHKRRCDRTMKMLAGENLGPKELDTSKEEIDGLDDKESGERKQDQQKMKEKRKMTPSTYNT
ncbi:hypothetical protein PIB30_022836 [Stylosanthes scabra]|uniref:Uncharacterized protein n=1 Tax=Stylosanthes scabra TaxID=79078 RepID=A0ABU6W7I7_9FABA|nr:hypothetical protein [Stylosanthes scabra]